MFNALRKMIFPIIVIVLLFFVAMIVLQWGLDLTGQGRFATARYAGTVNGEEISWDAFQSVYSNLYQTAAAETDEELPESKLIELETTAWNQLLQEHLLMQQAARHNIVVTDDDLYMFLRLNPPAYLLQYSLFQTEGQFDYQKYLGAMADPQWAPFWASVEPQARADLRKIKMQQLVIEAANITESEIQQAFIDAEEQVTVKMINVGYNRFFNSVPTPSDEELKAFYEGTKEDYPRDERVVLDVVVAAKEATDDDWEFARTTAASLYDSATAGADFEELARIYSEDVGSASNGGDLGWFERGRMVTAFDSLAFSMSEGDISEPVRTRFGWHVLLHHGYRHEKVIPRGKTEEELVRKAHVSHILIKAKASQETLDALYTQLEEFRQIATTEGFERASEATGLKVERLSPLLRNQRIDPVGTSVELSSFAFGEKVEAISGVLENDRNLFVAKIVRKIPKGPGEFDEVKARVKQALRNKTVEEWVTDTAEVIYAEIQNGTSMEEAAERHGEEVETPVPFTRNSSVAGLGQDPIAIGTAFSLTEPGQVSPPTKYPRGSVILSLVERSTADLATFNEKKDSIQASVMQAKQQRMYSRWYEKLIEDSEIENNVERQRQLADGSM